MATAETNLKADSASKKPAKAAPGAASTRPKRDLSIEEEPAIIGGNLIWAGALLLIAAIIPVSKLGEYIEPTQPAPTPVDSWGVGVNSDVKITLVTADYNLLACYSEQSFEGVHCGFKSATEAWPRSPTDAYDDNKLNIVQPYRTWNDNKLVFVAGLWAEPEVAWRLHHEPPAGMLPDKLARFAVQCQLHFVGKFDKVQLRWNPQQSWTDSDGPPWVAKASSCKIIEEQE